MTSYINVQRRTEFDFFIQMLRLAKQVVFDSETNTLFPYQHKGAMISMSFYFPEFDLCFNLPFRHGQGEVEEIVDNFDEINWQGKAKKNTYLSYWFKRYAENRDFGNLPIAWLEDIKASWALPTQTMWAHNARFDLHVMNAEGFKRPVMVYDTMIGLHTVHEDWGGIQVVAPYKYTKTDGQKGVGPKNMVGFWATDDSGKLLEKRQYGNRQLKWQAARLGLEGATVGEKGLKEATQTFQEALIDFIMLQWDDPQNESLILKSFAKMMTKGEVDQELWDKQRAKIAGKIEINEKSQMWMLPSSAVAEYAMLDTKLTWGLNLWCQERLVGWDNIQLYEDMSKIHYHLAYEMEFNGFKVDVEQAEKEIEKLDPRIADFNTLISQLTIGICWDNPDLVGTFDGDGCNLASPKQLKAFLNSGILGFELNNSLWPVWVDVEFTVNTATYPNIQVEATNKEALEPIEFSAVVRIIREWRRMQKSANTYLRNWLAAMDDDQVVRFSMNADGTVSGRFSSSGDAGNGQNIPDRNGYTIKRAIVPYSNEWVLFAIDYGQLELRLAAWIAEGLLKFDPNMTMTNLFISGEDMHSYVRDMVNVREVLFGNLDDIAILFKLGYKADSKEITQKAAETVAKFCRQTAKTMNFGLLYSGTKYMLSRLLKIGLDEADVLVQRWRRLFPAFNQAQSYYNELALTNRQMPNAPEIHRYVTQPISNRHRRFDLYPKWVSYIENGQTKGFDAREAEAKKAWNAVVQGLGGYLCGYSGMRFIEQNGNTNVKMFAQIHDALEGFVRIDHMRDIFILGQSMCDWPMINPALTVDIQGSKDGTWQNMETIVDVGLWVSSKGKEGY